MTDAEALALFLAVFGATVIVVASLLREPW